MLKKIVLITPLPNKTLAERLIKSKAIDLRDNCTIEDLGNGYSLTKIHDKSKLLQKL